MFIGGLTCIFLIHLSTDIEENRRGLTFGLSYSIGSIGTYLLSLPNDGNALTSDGILYVYICLAALFVLGAVLLHRSPLVKAEDVTGDMPKQTKKEAKNANSNLFVIFLLPVFFYIILTMGYHFEQANASEINIVFTRAFYALGLLAAGYINDKSRKTGAVCSLLALGFPLVCPALRNDADFALVFSIMSYVFLGFLSVFRVILFADIAAKRPNWAYLGGFGVAGGLLGNAIGTTLGLTLEKEQTMLACATLILYIVCGFLFYATSGTLYPAPEAAAPESAEQKSRRIFEEYVMHYNLNSKQTEVLRLLLDGHPNCEIAESLYLAESTVKYHVKNILKATGFTNRNDLIADFKRRQTEADS